MKLRLGLTLLSCWLILTGCPAYEDLQEDQGNNRELFEYLVASGAPAQPVSQFYHDYAADAANAYANADQRYSGRYVIAIGIVLAADPQNWFEDQISFWRSGADVEIILFEGGHALLCSFPEPSAALEEIEDNQVVAVVGLVQRSGAGSSLGLSLRRCEYIESF